MHFNKLPAPVHAEQLVADRKSYDGKLARCSHDTALRDIAALVERGILVRSPEGGRSTSYSLAMK